MTQSRPPFRLAALRLAALLAAPAILPLAPLAPTALAEAPATAPASKPSMAPPAVDDLMGVPLGEALDLVLGARAATGATYVARVVDLSTGRELYAHDADAPATPASNLKLLVTSTALGTWGAAHTFDTHFALIGDDLVVIGTGDPAFGDPTLAEQSGGHPTDPFDAVADALTARGVTAVRGDVVYYQNAFDAQRVHPSWDKDDLVEWYAAPVSGLAMNDNCIDVTVYPTKAGEAVRSETVPPIENYELVNAMVTAGGDNSGPAKGVPPAGPATAPAADGKSAEAADAAPEITKAPGRMLYTLTGTLKERDELQSKPVDDPGAFLADALRTRLAERGITVAGTLREATTAPEGVDPATLAVAGDALVHTHRSKMPDVLRRVNTNSQNLFAEMLCKGLGRAKLVGEGEAGESARGSWPAGEAAVKQYLGSKGVDVSALRVADGSGLSHDNKVTARAITDILLLMDASPDADTWRQSLTVAGKSGTIGKRMKDLEGKVLGKTGYIRGVRALSGYVLRDDGHPLAFSVIYNHIPGTVSPYEALQDDACRVLFRHDLPPE